MRADRAALKFCLGAETEREGFCGQGYPDHGRARSWAYVKWKHCWPCQQAENLGKIGKVEGLTIRPVRQSVSVDI